MDRKVIVIPKLPLLARAAIAVVAVGLLPLAVAWWMLTGINREGMTRQVLRTHAVAASTAARRIASYVESRMATARSIAAADAIAEDASSVTSRELLQSLLQGDSSLFAISIVAPSGDERIRVQRKERAGEMPLVLETARRADRQITVVRSNQLWTVASWPATDGGSVRVVADGSPLEAAVRAKELGQEAEIAVVLRGRLLFGSARSLSDFPPEMLAVSNRGLLDGSGVFGKGERSVIGAYAAVGETGWVVLSRQPARVARAVEADMRRGSLSAAAVALALAAIVSILAWVTVVRPLKRVAEAQRRVVGTVATQGDDEIAQLRNGVAVLERRRSDQETLGRVFLGRYAVLDLLGEGGMGSVFRGWDPRLQRTVALKTIRFEGADRYTQDFETLVASLVHEAVTIARFSHANIVSVFDVEETADGAFVAMEFVNGPNLDSYLRARGVLTPDEATLIGVAVANALATAHRQSVVHRDVKPANVLLGREGAIKVSDFGLARPVGSIRKERFVFGTPGYVAPECVTGGTATAASDLFSLGVLLYDCVTAHHPFHANTVATTFQATLRLDPPAPSFYNSRVNSELEALIVQLMRKNPAERPASAAEVAQRLEAQAVARNLRWVFIDPGDAGTSGTATLRVAV